MPGLEMRLEIRQVMELQLIPPTSVRLGETLLILSGQAYRAIRAAVAHESGVAVSHFAAAVWGEEVRRSRNALRMLLRRLNARLSKCGYHRLLTLDGDSVVWFC